ncbi:hypothetical protein Ciccas_002864 [Cichlidogyrus casuarinus]|uniref:Uncharacterized protein n=1 Tax=Cichlidogyrus casuarinus TaxID=1844966 RepID=A0ABD2QG32_9PLAT
MTRLSLLIALILVTLVGIIYANENNEFPTQKDLELLKNEMKRSPFDHKIFGGNRRWRKRSPQHPLHFMLPMNIDALDFDE